MWIKKEIQEELFFLKSKCRLKFRLTFCQRKLSGVKREEGLHPNLKTQAIMSELNQKES